MLFEKFVDLLFSRHHYCEESVDCEVFFEDGFFVVVSQGIEVDRISDSEI